jgi:hypothetical protein
MCRYAKLLLNAFLRGTWLKYCHNIGVPLVHISMRIIAPCQQALKYRSVTDIVRPIREIVRRREETTGLVSDLSETEVYCLSDPSVLVSDRTVALSDVNQNET